MAEQHKLVQRARKGVGAIHARHGEHHGMVDLFLSAARALLAKAFRGELVPQDPNDEPVVLSPPPSAAPADEPPVASRVRARATAASKTTAPAASSRRSRTR